MIIRFVMPLIESLSSAIGPISFDMKLAGKPDAGKPHVRFDVAGTGNVMIMGA